MPDLPPENQYAHTKKLGYLIDGIERHRSALGRPITLLDFGCGNGAAVSQYLIGDDIEYYGVDIHQPSLDHASSRYGGPHARFVSRVPHDVEFDIIVYADILEHLDDPVDLLRTHRGLLSANGIMIGAVPNGYGPFEIEQRLDRWLGLSRFLAWGARTWRKVRKQRPDAEADALPYNHESGHLVFFTRRSLTRTIVDAGLEIVSFSHGSFVGASVSGVLLAHSRRLLHLNARIADKLPYWAVSTWYFTIRPAP